MSAWQPYSLTPQILEALSAQGFAQPTPIQEACLPAAIRDRLDIIGAAQTGSGKTLAFALPILQLISQEQDGAVGGSGAGGKLRALIMCPTRELALQVRVP